jgi:undecaprenyl diphosphate synthase
MNIMTFYLTHEISHLIENNIRLKVIGDKSKLNPDMQDAIKNAEVATNGNTGLTLYIALSYGGKDEIVRALNKIIATNPMIKEVSEQMISDNLDDPEMPDVDLVIRTSGEMRSSNFLIWQIAYRALYFSDVLWPDFDETDSSKL